MAPGARRLTGDAGHDADRVRRELPPRGVPPAIPPNPAREGPAPPDRGLHRPRDRVERPVSRPEQSRAAAARHGGTAGSFPASVHLAAARVRRRLGHTA